MLFLTFINTGPLLVLLKYYQFSCMALLEFIFTRHPEPVNVMSDSKPVGGVMTEGMRNTLQLYYIPLNF